MILCLRHHNWIDYWGLLYWSGSNNSCLTKTFCLECITKGPGLPRNYLFCSNQSEPIDDQGTMHCSWRKIVFWRWYKRNGNFNSLYAGLMMLFDITYFGQNLHYLTPYGNVVNWTLEKKFPSNLNQNIKCQHIFIESKLMASVWGIQYPYYYMNRY